MINKMKTENLKDINKLKESFEIIGKIIPKYENDTWTFSELLYDEPYLKRYPDDEKNYLE